MATIELKKIVDKEKAEKAKEEAERKAEQARIEAERKAVAEQVKQAQQQAEQDGWERAKSEHTVVAYGLYLESWPKGRYAGLAIAGRQKVERDAAEQEKREQQRVEQDAWQRARNEQTVAAYGNYLDGWPNGRYAGLALVGKQAAEKEAVERENAGNGTTETG